MLAKTSCHSSGEKLRNLHASQGQPGLLHNGPSSARGSVEVRLGELVALPPHRAKSGGLRSQWQAHSTLRGRGIDQVGGPLGGRCSWAHWGGCGLERTCVGWEVHRFRHPKFMGDVGGRIRCVSRVQRRAGDNGAHTSTSGAPRSFRTVYIAYHCFEYFYCQVVRAQRAVPWYQADESKAFLVQ